jgi:type I restriction enzyme S subunit
VKTRWQTEKLGDVCAFLNRGVSPKYVEQGGVCVLNQKCIRDHRVSYEPSRRHDAKVKTVSAERYIQVGDVLVNSTGTGTLGRVAQVRDVPPEPTTVDSHVTIVRPKPGKFFPDFFGYMLVVIEEAIQESGEGCGGQTELARSVLADRFTVSYPTSVDEQQRIVAILDAAFDGIATAKANFEANLQNARALFESHLQSVFTERGEGWTTKPLAGLCEASRVITYGVIKLGEEVADGVPCLRTSNVRWLRIETDGMKRIAPALSADFSRTILKGGEVLVNVRGTLGGVAVAAPEMAGWNVSREVAVVPVDSRTVNPEFLSYLIGSGTSQQWLGGVKKGAAYVGINIEDLRLLPVSAPPMQDQIRIVRHLKSLGEETQHLESIYQRKLAALDALKQSLLHQAFSGQLTEHFVEEAAA